MADAPRPTPAKRIEQATRDERLARALRDNLRRRKEQARALPVSAPGIALTQHIGDLSRLAEAPPDHFRLLLGYAGWGEGQLLEEILRNDWLTAPVSDELIFAPDPEQVWDAALRSVGSDPAALPSWMPGGSSGESAN